MAGTFDADRSTRYTTPLARSPVLDCSGGCYPLVKDFSSSPLTVVPLVVTWDFTGPTRGELLEDAAQPGRAAVRHAGDPAVCLGTNRDITWLHLPATGIPARARGG